MYLNLNNLMSLSLVSYIIFNENQLYSSNVKPAYAHSIELITNLLNLNFIIVVLAVENTN